MIYVVLLLLYIVIGLILSYFMIKDCYIRNKEFFPKHYKDVNSLSEFLLYDKEYLFIALFQGIMLGPGVIIVWVITVKLIWEGML